MVTLSQNNKKGKVELEQISIKPRCMFQANINNPSSKTLDNEEILKNDLGVSTAPPNSPVGDPQPCQSDFQVYIPKGQDGPDSCNQHFLVVPLPNGEFLATWTMGSLEGAGDQHIVISKSKDCGKTWTSPQCLMGPEEDGFIASWGFPLVANDRIYIFYNKHKGYVDFHHQWTGQLWFQYSDDFGQTWSSPFKHLKVSPNSYSHKVFGTDPNWIVYQAPMRTASGTVLVGFTHIATRALSTRDGIFSSEVRFIRFDNILTENDPEKLKITTLPENGEDGLRMTDPRHPETSLLQEPTIQNLSDGRLICVMRSGTGYAAYSVSNDDGNNWSMPEILRYCEGGAKVEQPITPCPLYKLKDGKFILIFHNNDGSANQGRHVADWCRNRRPVYLLVGREIFDSNNKQPLVFSEPRLLADNDRIPISKKQLTEIGTYPSLFEYEDKVYFFFPDRKHFLLGKVISPELLSDDGVPEIG